MNLDLTNRAVLAHPVRDALDRLLRPLARIGEWTPVAFNAAHFTGSGAMTWTVAGADVTTFAYTVVGHTMTVAWSINTTTVGGTVTTSLRIRIPRGATARRLMIAPFYYVDNGTRGMGYWQVTAGSPDIQLFKSDVTNWTASTNATAAHGTATFEMA